MPRQLTVAPAESNAKRKLTRRDRFLAEMEQVVPWALLLEALAPYYYPNAGRRAGRPPIGLERMLRMYFLQQWYGLADAALEDAVYDSRAFCGFLGIDLEHERVPDATTLLGFRRLLEKHELTKRLFDTVKEHLRARGLLLEKGTLVDASIFNAPSSTKNKDKARDPAMHQTRKGNQWYFGAKAHTGTDADSGLVHSVTCTAANVADITETANLLHGQEQEVYLDAAYIGADKRDELKDRDLTWYIAQKRSKVAAIEDAVLKDLTKRAEHLKAKVRARVEHPYHIVKNLFRHRKLRYKGLEKNGAQFQILFALANLVIAKKALLA